MKVCLLAPSSPADDLLARHAAGLARAGHDVVVHLPGTPLAAEPCDVAVAWGWEPTVRLFEVPATRHALWADGLGFERLGSWQVERVAALAAYDLPVGFFCAAPWVQRVLAERRPDAPVLLTRTGLDHERFEAADRGAGEGPLHVLVDPRGDGLGAAAAAQGGVVVTELAAGRLQQQLRDADVLVFLDPVDGVLGVPLQAARAGVVPVVLPAGGQEDLVEHLVSGIVATPEDPRGTGRWLDRLAADRELLGRLRGAARERAAAWPSWDDATDELEGALATLLEAPPPATTWPVRLMGDLMAGVATYRNDHALLAEELHTLRADGAVATVRRVRERVKASRVAPLVRAARRLR